MYTAHTYINEIATTTTMTKAIQYCTTNTMHNVNGGLSKIENEQKKTTPQTTTSSFFFWVFRLFLTRIGTHNITYSLSLRSLFSFAFFWASAVHVTWCFCDRTTLVLVRTIWPSLLLLLLLLSWNEWINKRTKINPKKEYFFIDSSSNVLHFDVFVIVYSWIR